MYKKKDEKENKDDVEIEGDEFQKVQNEVEIEGCNIMGDETKNNNRRNMDNEEYDSYNKKKILIIISIFWLKIMKIKELLMA